MLTNASCTIYNRRINPNTGGYEYVRHFIPAVHWHTKQKVAVSDKGVNSADIHMIRIPEEQLSNYLLPEEYHKLSYEEQLTVWTAENQDLFVRGECNVNIQSIKDLEKLHVMYGAINSWSDNRFGGVSHIRIGGAA